MSTVAGSWNCAVHRRPLFTQCLAPAAQADTWRRPLKSCRDINVNILLNNMQRTFNYLIFIVHFNLWKLSAIYGISLK